MTGVWICIHIHTVFSVMIRGRCGYHHHTSHAEAYALPGSFGRGEWTSERRRKYGGRVVYLSLTTVYGSGSEHGQHSRIMYEYRTM